MLTDVKIKTRLAVGYSLLALAILVVSIMAFMALSKAQDAFTHQVESIELVGKLSNDINDNASARAIGARNLVIATSQAAMENEVSAIKAAHKKMGEDLGKIKSKVSSMRDATVGLRSALDKVEATEFKYGPIALEITRLGSIGEKDAAIQKINMECRPLLAELIKELHQLQDEIQKISQTSVDASNSEFKALRLVLIGVGIVVVLMALFLGITTTRSIINPLNKAVASTRNIAGGDLNQMIHAPGNDEISELLKSLEAMRVSLCAVVGNVRQGSESVATASSEIAQGNHDLSARTEQQASALEQTAASMEELGSTVKHNADNAKQANQLAMNAVAVAVKGGEVVGQAVETMKGINESSRKIADIISVIDGIAFQTNILALNAAVEAARAGEQGRGFAVVASEVRALAGRSADAAKEIKSLITSSVERVEKGSSQVDAAGATMAEVVHSIKRVTDIMGEISAASNEQAMGVAQVGEAVTLMDQATQQNAALVEEMAAAASSLKSQAQELVQVVAVFTVEDQGGTFSRNHSSVQPMDSQLGNSFKSIVATKK